MSFVNVAPSSSNLWVAVGSGGASIKYSSDGSNWSNATTGGFSGGNGVGVAWNGRMWIAVGSDSTRNIKYSLDGMRWYPTTGKQFQQLGFGVAWNGKLWVAVGQDTASGAILYSRDGFAWDDINVTNVFSTAGLGVAWNGTMWVAVGQDATQNNTIKYSYNGSNWSNSSGSGFISYGSGVAWNGRMWVAVGGDTTPDNTIKYSYDGITWSNSSGSGFTTAGLGVAWNGQLWVAVGDDSTQGNRIKYSYDGINWSNATPGGAEFTAYGQSVAWNGSYWIGVGSGSQCILTSLDGVSWTYLATNDFSTAGNGIAYSSNTTPAYLQTNLEILPQSIPLYLRSTNQIFAQPSSLLINNLVEIDGTTKRLDVYGTGRFQTVSTLALNVSSINGALPGSGSGNGSSIGVSTGALYASSMSFVNVAPSSSNLWIAVGYDTVQPVKYSRDGSNWSDVPGSKVFSGGQGHGVAWNGSMWVAGGDDSTQPVKYSYDGMNWSNAGEFQVLNGGIAYGVAWNGKLWIAVGSDNQQAIKYSGDVLNWSNGINAAGGKVFSGDTGRGVAWNGSMWVAVGSDSTQAVKYSYDGITWSNAAGGNVFSTGSGRGVAWNGRMWVAVGSDSTQVVKYSYDGITWSNAAGGKVFSAEGCGVAWNGALWVAVGDDSTQNVKYSYDGINWSNAAGASVFSGSSGNGVAWNGALWVAVGGDFATQSIKYSRDGITWSDAPGGPIFNFLVGFGVAYSSNVIPSYKQTNFEIEPQNIPVFLRSTNQVSFTQSTIIFNNTLSVDARNRVGINIGTPQTELDVAGTGRFQILSSLALNISSINGTQYVAGGLTTGNLQSTVGGLGQIYRSSLINVPLVSTLALNISSINGTVYTAGGGGGSGNGSSIGVSTGSLYASSISFLNVSPTTTSNLWIAVGQDSTANNTIKWSLDGSTWSNSSGTGFTSYGRGVAWSGSLWVAAGQDNTANNTLKWSRNGISWSNSSSGGFTSNSGVAGIGMCVAWNGRIWVAGGLDMVTGGNANLKYSVNGSNWSNSTGATFTSYAAGVAWNGRMWVAVGSDSGGGNLKYSFNGINWSNSSGATFSAGGAGVAWNGVLWVATGGDGTPNNTLKYSGDGMNWSNSAGPGFTSDGYAIGWNGRMWVAMGTDSTQYNTIKYSGDGINWSNSLGTAWSGGRGQGIAWNGRLWVATGYETGPTRGTTKTSLDGITWIDNPSQTFTTQGWGVAFSSNLIPSYRQENLQILPSGIPLFLTSTNQIFAGQSTLVVNNALTIDGFTDRVGIRTGIPQTELDVAGTGRFQQVSTLALTMSSINGSLFFPGSSISLSTGSLITSSVTFGSGTGWITAGALQAVVVSTVQFNSALGYVSSLYCGSTNVVSFPFYTAHINGAGLISSLLIGQPLGQYSYSGFRLAITQDSAFKPGTNLWTTTSDERVKENIVDADLDRCYNDVKSIRLRRFEWNPSFRESWSGTDRHVLGFIAHEVSSIVPKAVTTQDAFGYPNFQFLNIDQVNMSLFGSVKKLITTNEQLQSTVKGERLEFETLKGTTLCMLSTLKGLQQQ